MQISIRDFPREIAVELGEDILKKISTEASRMYGTKTRAWKLIASKTRFSWRSIKNKFKPSHPHRIPLSVVFLATDMFEIGDDELIEAILSYSVVRGSTSVVAPRIPIDVSPVFDMLAAHHISDGTLVCSDGRMAYFGYRQFDKSILLSYKHKLERVFGKIHYSKDYARKDSTTRIYAPVAASQIILSYLNQSERSYLSKTASIPAEIISRPQMHQLAFLVGVFIDEGSVDANQVVIRMKNPRVIRGLKQMCLNLNYSCKTTTYENGMNQLYIHARSIPKFLADIKKLQKEYPFITLSYKEDLLKEAVRRLRKPRRYVPGNKKRILHLLYKGALTVNEVALLCSMTRQGARYHIKTLINTGQVRHVDTIPGKPPEYVYSAWE